MGAGSEWVEQVEVDGVSRFGLHRLHLLRWGRFKEKDIQGAMEMARSLAASRGCEAEIMAFYRYEEAGGLGLWHLRVYWKELSAGTQMNTDKCG